MSLQEGHRRAGQCLNGAQESEPTDVLKRMTQKTRCDSQEVRRHLKGKQDQDGKPIEKIVNNSRGKCPIEFITSIDFRKGCEGVRY